MKPQRESDSGEKAIHNTKPANGNGRNCLSKVQGETDPISETKRDSTNR
jgi:hypothetical protein